MRTTSRVKAYIKYWEDNCYPQGIPDELPMALQLSGRAPSYKALCQAILSNDLTLKKLGFDSKCPDWVSQYKTSLKACKKQLKLDI